MEHTLFSILAVHRIIFSRILPDSLPFVSWYSHIQLGQILFKLVQNSLLENSIAKLCFIIKIGDIFNDDWEMKQSIFLPYLSPFLPLLHHNSFTSPNDPVIVVRVSSSFRFPVFVSLASFHLQGQAQSSSPSPFLLCLCASLWHPCALCVLRETTANLLQNRKLRILMNSLHVELL